VGCKARGGSSPLGRMTKALHSGAFFLVAGARRFRPAVVAEVVQPPLKLATMIGDVVHNLRSSHDHLVFELAFLGQRGKKVPGRGAFPVSPTRSNWNSKHVQDTLLAGGPPEAPADDLPAPALRSAAGHARTAGSANRRRKPLADLEALWKDDKHRVLESVFLAPSCSAAGPTARSTDQASNGPRPSAADATARRACKSPRDPGGRSNIGGSRNCCNEGLRTRVASRLVADSARC
jgi:hypothetical protein